ncbi:Hsp33 family molecular chaperone HslO [Natribacillus halophilus]|uniref:33 kDa chaperonin n=1 Tax=Natribacillus halophilus TaxID=549003 RepID=A0A1G8RHX4_9BACI|nr:Hsp33 family molecular chaperone HslO [Natribacillus halophilus]SDJ16463.1 molecular chaperone Hsp33 [Natribacillus halophilus]
MQDYLIKATAFQQQARVYVTRTTEMVNEAVRRHQAYPTAAAALGRTMTAGTMMGAMMSGDDKLTVKVEGDGPLGYMIADSNAQGETRGYVHNPHVHFELNRAGKLDVARAVGTDGHIAVARDLGMKEQFTSHSPLVSGELGEDFTHYFATSEQVPSSVGLGVLVDTDHSILAAGGFILQVLPGATEETIDLIEKHIEASPPISKLIERRHTPESIMETITGGEYQFLEQMPVQFRCPCSKERIGRAIVGLGSEEIQAMITEDQGAETECHFCHAQYHFSADDLLQLKTEALNQEEHSR